MKACFLKALLIVHIFVWSSVAISSNYDFLRHSVIAEYDDSDMELLLDHVQIGLNENRTVDWYNETTGHGGTIAPGGPATYKDLTCRYAKITNKSKKQQATTNFIFCKMEDGKWKIVSVDQND